MSPTTEEITPVWESYLDAEEDVKPWLQFDKGEVFPNDTQLRLVTDMACTWVQNYLGRPVAPMQFFRRFSGYWGTGNGGSFIDLPYYPVLTTQTSSTYSMTVIEYWGTSGPHTLAEQTPASQGTQDMYALEPLQGRITRAFLGLVPRPFFPGLRNIEVTWWAGYNPVPADLKIATLEFVNWWWRNTQEAPRTSALVADEYAAAGAGGLWPGVPKRVTDLLQPYVQIGIG